MGEEKMSVLAGLKPERGFYYFEELCRIPHGSGNTKEVSDYLVQFARDHELSWYQDASNNVVIRRPASKGCELAPTVILQGHCDMVCEGHDAWRRRRNCRCLYAGCAGIG